MPHNRRNQSFKPASIEREFGLQHRPFVVQDHGPHRRDGVHRAHGLTAGHLPNAREPGTHLFGPEGGIRVEYDVLNGVVIKQAENGVSQFASELHFEPLALLVLYDR